ncbi:MAG TPA: diacylglycerol kinase family protein [Dermatophilaceae bacterium]|nr:diacylglycerol kinase family protein [Dermatophilaceae bacterium]
MLSDVADWIGAAAITLLVLLAVGALLAVFAPVQWTAEGSRLFGRRRPARAQFAPRDRPAPRRVRRAAIVVNPTKFDDTDALRRQVTRVCLDHGWAEPLWLETTAEDPGTGQTSRAIEQGAGIVCALGGDGTVRAVAAALVGTETAIGLLPGGTGNLLARNLQLPIDSIDNSLRVALTGQNKRIDVGRISVTPADTQEQPKDYMFLVMAGLGFDATIMAEAPEKLKKHLGWVAYSVAGLKHLRGPRFKVQVSVDDGPELHRRVRTVVVGNCGKLQGGLVLLPEAQVDDGWLDAVLLSPSGIVGWVAVLVRVLTRRRRGHERVDHHRVRSLRISCDRPEDVQLDGDVIGPARAVRIDVEPHALLVRVG